MLHEMPPTWPSACRGHPPYKQRVTHEKVEKEWATLYAAAHEVDFDQQLWDASKAIFQDTGGSDRETLFFSMCRWQGTNVGGQL